MPGLNARHLRPLIGDLLLVPPVMVAAFQLRFGLQSLPSDFLRSALLCSPLLLLAATLCWFGAALHRSTARLPVLRLALAALAAGVLGSLLIVLLHGLDKVPRSSLFILGPLLWLAWLARRLLSPLLLPPLARFVLRFRPYVVLLGGLLRRMLAALWLHRRQVLDLALFLGFCGILYWAFQDRATQINGIFGEFLGCDDCLTSALFLHDYLFFGALLLLFLLSFLARPFFLYLPLRLLALAGLVLYVGDIVLMDEFYTRLMFSDIRVYGEQLPIVWRHVADTGMFAGQAWVLPLALGTALLLLLVPPVGKASRKAVVALCVLPLVTLSSGSVLSPPSFAHDWALRNVVAANFNTGVAEPYSDAYRRQLLDTAAGRTQLCRPGSARAPDIVLLVLESWSPYQSSLWSGIENWTPRLDAIAQRNAWFTRVHAGGFTTNEGLLSIFAGLEFLSPAKGYFSIMPFETGWETPASIPRTLADNAGYHTAFLTTGNLGFTRKGEWLRNLGFDYVEGHDHRSYRRQPRLHFDAVADEFLYARSLDYIRERRDDGRPLFLAIENVSTHHPYIHPITGERSGAAVVGYMDSTVEAFHRQLQESGFFDKGLLLIVGDHRAMIPVTEAETERFGQATVSLVPAVVVGSELRGEIATPFHQSDILPTLGMLTAGEHCYTGAYRNLLEPEGSEPRCLYHARGDNRDHIDAFCPLADGSEARAVIGLRGDDTQILESTGMSPELEYQVLQEINTQRVLGDERTRRLLDSGYFD